MRLYDTAGCDLNSPNNFLQKEIMIFNEKLIIDSDLILFVVDSKIGLTKNDFEFASYLRKFHSKTFLISVVFPVPIGPLIAIAFPMD